MSQLLCRNVTIAYEKDIIVKDLSFQADTGDYISIVGENGTGKSSLLKAILGLIHVKSGEIQFGDGLKRNNIGYLSQQNPLQKDFPRLRIRSSAVRLPQRERNASFLRNKREK